MIWSKMNKWALFGTAAAAVAGLALNAHADNKVENAKNDTWLTVSGTVVSTGPDAFRLDYGDGVITVEMDDFDAFPEGYQMMENDEAVVYGKVDHGLFEDKKIEASSVYVENLGTHFYASAYDEEGLAVWSATKPIVVGDMEVTGTVEAVNGREFTVSTGLGKITVDTLPMAFNPMDDKGFLKIEKGDRVKVGGDLDRNLFDTHEVDAEWLVELKD